MGRYIQKNRPNMKKPRKSALQKTPRYEDAGLFRHKLCHVRVELVAKMHYNRRKDIVVKGYLKDGREIDVLFAGRRASDAAAIIKLLRGLQSKLRQPAFRKRLEKSKLSAIRLPVEVEGAWRPQFTMEKDGFQDRRFQLIAARWNLSNGKGRIFRYGKPAMIGAK